MVIVILGILAATALPRFIDLSTQAKVAAAKGNLGAIRAAVAMQYASNAATNQAQLFPTTITTGMFANNQIPVDPLTSSASITNLTASVAPAATGVGFAYFSGDGSVWINNSNYTTY